MLSKATWAIVIVEIRKKLCMIILNILWFVDVLNPIGAATNQSTNEVHWSHLSLCLEKEKRNRNCRYLGTFFYVSAAFLSNKQVETVMATQKTK